MYACYFITLLLFIAIAVAFVFPFTCIHAPKHTHIPQTSEATADNNNGNNKKTRTKFSLSIFSRFIFFYLLHTSMSTFLYIIFRVFTAAAFFSFYSHERDRYSYVFVCVLRCDCGERESWKKFVEKREITFCLCLASVPCTAARGLFAFYRAKNERNHQQHSNCSG